MLSVYVLKLQEKHKTMVSFFIRDEWVGMSGMPMLSLRVICAQKVDENVVEVWLK